MSVDRIRGEIATGKVRGAYVDGVPFIRQRRGECGPAALAMLAGAWGMELDPEEIAGEVYLPSLRGTLNVDLAAYAQRLGFWVRSYRSDPADLKEKLDAGVPVIVLARVPGFLRSVGHYFLVIGYDDDRGIFIAHSGSKANQILPQGLLDSWWARNRRWALLLLPPEKATWRLSAEEENDLGVWYERRGRPEEALRRYEASLEKAPGRAYVQVNLGNVLASLGRPEEAESAYRRALAAEPDNVAALNNLACLLAAEGGRTEESLALARRAVEVDRVTLPNSLDTLALVLIRAGRTAEARKCVERALILCRETGQDSWVPVLEHRLEEIRESGESGDPPAGGSESEGENVP